MRSFLMVLLIIGLSTSGVSVSVASPQPDFECTGANAATSFLFPATGGMGEYLYKVSEDEIGLIGYSEGKDRLKSAGTSDNGTRYSGQGLEFFESSEDNLDHSLTVEATGQRIACQPTKVATNIEAAGDKGWVSGRALGSIVRETPSVDGAQIDKLPPNETVAILRNEGNVYQGYPWFQIEYYEGAKGFVWGGTLCSEETLIEGVELQCE